jgi:hypothetical protein
VQKFGATIVEVAPTGPSPPVTAVSGTGFSVFKMFQ